ncbi:hypothetical protein SAMN05660642_01160 [Geodermatophilus siccatus]|uniref:Uncharacterized protein n=1 Tax=Geodermatophilus siccatus TaxID=1137991 RepID=A0A1G9NRT5_9ACTN|nr:hypothetical protein [Geodermatophilus siccatus]SDL89316.1 hypothetical protein SAMN05660642_01160 [Geodermatophilus siccatus]
MSAHPPHNGDDPLLAELAEARSAARAVPESMRVAARAAFAWRSVEEGLELLVLAHDSALGTDAGDVRAAPPDGPRELAFRGAALSVELEVDADVRGRLVPPGPGRVTLAGPLAVLAEAEADALGCFRLPRPGCGQVRLVCRTEDAAVTTGWVRL